MKTKQKSNENGIMKTTMITWKKMHATLKLNEFHSLRPPRPTRYTIPKITWLYPRKKSFYYVVRLDKYLSIVYSVSKRWYATAWDICLERESERERASERKTERQKEREPPEKKNIRQKWKTRNINQALLLYPDSWRWYASATKTFV